ncbi:hypothetical protein Tco_0007571 [Tanacetum coccineum]
MEFFGYKHLEEITVRRQDDVLYKFREGDFKRLRHEDIEDMLLLLVQGIIYQDDIDRNRLMRTDELHKFSDGTLNHVCTSLNYIATGIQMEYLLKRKWTKQDKFYTSAGNPIKEILLKLNLPDHRILKDGGEDFRYSDTERLSRSDEVLKLKNFKKDATLKLSKSTNQEWYDHVGPEVTRSQDDKVTRWQNEIMLR